MDVEASFVEPEDVYGWGEGLMERLAAVAEIEARPPFPRLTWHQSMERFGSDRPDLRCELEIDDFSEVLGALDSVILRGAVAQGGRIRGLRLEGGGRLSRRQIDAIEQAAKATGAPGLLWAKVQEDRATGPLGRFFRSDTRARLALSPRRPDRRSRGAGPRHLAGARRRARGRHRRAAAAPGHRARVALGDRLPRLRNRLGRRPGGEPPPLPSSPTRTTRTSWTRTRLPCAASATDLVYNGTEFGSGSMRVHDADLQTRILSLLGLPADEIEARFGFLLNALRSGAPPHGGIALGVDRIAVCFSGGTSLRDVIAFPKTTAARALFRRRPCPRAPGRAGRAGDRGVPRIGVRAARA